VVKYVLRCELVARVLDRRRRRLAQLVSQFRDWDGEAELGPGSANHVRVRYNRLITHDGEFHFRHWDCSSIAASLILETCHFSDVVEQSRDSQ